MTAHEQHSDNAQTQQVARFTLRLRCGDLFLRFRSRLSKKLQAAKSALQN